MSKNWDNQRIKVLTVGDVVADLGINAICNNINDLIKENDIDFTVVNVENAADGRGLTPAIYKKFRELPIDAMTLGNHTFAKMEIYKVFKKADNLIRPLNYADEVPGKGYLIFEKNGIRYAVLSAMGRGGINISLDDPFSKTKKVLNKLKNEEVDVIICDFHAETTAEKLAFGRYFAKKPYGPQIIYGTHTHIQTADERILADRCGYITDLGMTGSTEGVLGMKEEVAFKRFFTGIPERYAAVETGRSSICGCIFTLERYLNPQTNKSEFRCVEVERFERVIEEGK